MTTTVDTLILDYQVDNDKLSSGLSKAQNRIDSFANKASGAFGKIAAAYAVMLSVKGFTDIITQFEKFEASLVTVTGSAEAASKAFAGLQEFAATTPFQITEMVDAFIKLKALGLTPSEEALTSYGNTATAMGKSLNQMIEAVADAATGEFERLKEFGIKASSEGDRVTFTFQNVATTVGKNATEIERYLRSIGEVQFAGAMAQQADTLNVSLSNAADSIDKLVKELGDAGITDILIGITELFKGIVSTVTIVVRGFRAIGYSALELGSNINAATAGLLGFDKAALQASASAEYYGDVIENLLNPEGGLPTDDTAITINPIPDAEEMEESLEKFKESLASAYEIEQEYYVSRLEGLQVYKDNELVTQEEYNTLLEKEKKRHEDKIKEIEKSSLNDREKFNRMSMKDQAKTIFGELDKITAGVAQHNRALFEANKVAGIANAIVNAYEGISLTLSKYPFPLNVGLAAAHATAAFAQVNAIRSASFSGGGGGGAPSSAGVSTDATVSDVTSGTSAASNSLSISLSGVNADQSYSGEQVQSLINAINEAVEDGAIIKSVSVSS